MKLTYWVSNCLDDHPAYNLRSPSKQLAEIKLVKARQGGMVYGEVHKTVIEYEDAFDLVCILLGEDGVSSEEE